MSNETLKPATMQAVGVGGTTGLGHHDSYCLEVKQRPGHDSDHDVHPGSNVVATLCNNGLESQRWSYNENGDERIQVGRRYLCLGIKDCKKGEVTIHQCEADHKKKTHQQWTWQDGPIGRQVKNKKCKKCIGVRYATDGGGDSLLVSAWACKYKDAKNTDWQFCNHPGKQKKGCKFVN